MNLPNLLIYIELLFFEKSLTNHLCMNPHDKGEEQLYSLKQIAINKLIINAFLSFNCIV